MTGQGRAGRRGIPAAELPTVPRAEVWAQACPRCRAGKGRPCRTQQGQILRGGHRERRVRAAQAAYRAGRRRRNQPPPVDPARLSPDARARREAYAVEQEQRRAAAAASRTAGPRPPTVDARGRLVVNAADAVSRLTPPPSWAGAVLERQPAQIRPARRPAAGARSGDQLLEPPCQTPGPPAELAATFAAARLRVEMVPKPLWERSLKKELPEQQWRQIRDRVTAAAGHRCEVCGGQGPRHPVECHEEWGYDDTTCVQRLVRLVALCPDCHLAKTPGRAEWLASEDRRYSGLPKQVHQHLAEINGWDADTATAFVRWSTLVNQIRGVYAWTQDLGTYGRFGAADRIGAAEALCQQCFTIVPAHTLDAAGRGPCCA